MKRIYGLISLILSLAISSPLAARASAVPTQTGQPATAANAPAPTWTIDQAVTCSVHDAWVLGGKNEEGFFAIVKALAELSEQKRGLTLPDSEEVGHKFGEYIKTQAKADRDQLLYVIVDRAVRMYAAKPAATAAK